MRSSVQFAFLLLAVALAPDVARGQTITIGVTASTSDAPIFIADRRGYFRDEGLAVQVVNFRSAAGCGMPP